MIMLIGLFGFIVVKEVSLPPAVMAACGGLALLGLLMTGLQRPEIPLYVLVIYMPFSRVLAGDFGTEAFAFNMTNILIGWVVIGYAIKSSNRPEKVPMGSPLNKVILFFCLMGALSLVRAGFEYGGEYFSEFIPQLKQWLTPVMLYFLVLWVVRDKKMIKTVATLIMVVMTVVALMAIRDYIEIGDTDLEKARIGGIAEHSNTLGAFFVYYMFLFYGFLLIFYKKARTWLLMIPFLLCFRGIMVTFSRGAYLGFAAGAFTGAFFRSKALFAAMLLGALFIVVVPGVLPAGIRYRMSQTVEHKSGLYQPETLEEGLEASASIRLKIWRGAIQMIKDNPMWGVGYGAFPAHIPAYTQGQTPAMDAHNSYLLIAAEMGLPTLAVFLIVLLMAMYYAWWLYRRATDLVIKAIALGVLSGWGGLWVTNMFGSRMDDQAVASYFWILCALIMRGIHLQRQEMKVQRLAGSRVSRLKVS